MAKKKIVDPTLPFTEITLDGKTYKMCLDFQAVAEVEEQLGLEGHEVSLLASHWRGRMKDTCILFAASLRLHQPDLPFEGAVRLVNWDNAGEVTIALRKARGMFLPEPDEVEPADPPEAPGR